MRIQRSHMILLFSSLAIVGACTESPAGLDLSAASSGQFDGEELSLDARHPVHQATLGGADICEALNQATGCDANFSLVANGYADGSVSGQWRDQFGDGGGVQVDVTCLAINGNEAVIGGVVKASTDSSYEIGDSVLTAVVDNGTSKLDPPDELSFTINTSLWANPSCHGTSVQDLRQNPGLYAVTNGQVRVR